MVFTAPQLEYGALAPMLIIFAAALIGVIVEAFVKRRGKPETLPAARTRRPACSSAGGAGSSN